MIDSLYAVEYSVDDPKDPPSLPVLLPLAIDPVIVISPTNCCFTAL